MNEILPYGLLIALVTGLLGSTFFMLIQLQERLAEGSLTDARDMWTMPMIVLRCIVGVGAAAVLYFFFKSGLMDGSLWPKLHTQGFEVVKRTAGASTDPSFYVPNRDLALLIVWSFIAGYSQTLVPNLLLSTEGRQGKPT